MNFTMKCRIDDAEFVNNSNFYTVSTPVPDAYSHPNSYRLRSLNQLGDVGQEIFVDVVVSGYVRRKPYQDKKTGQPKVYHEQNVFFDAVLSQSNQLKAAK